MNRADAVHACSVKEETHSWEADVKLRAVLIALSLALAGGIPSLITAAGTVALLTGNLI